MLLWTWLVACTLSETRTLAEPELTPPNPVVQVGPAYAGYGIRMWIDGVPVGTRLRFYASTRKPSFKPCATF